MTPIQAFDACWRACGLAYTTALAACNWREHRYADQRAAMVVRLRHTDGYSVEEIAKILGAPSVAHVQVILGSRT